jgi:Skp family chaperone for outer membrane proteins
MALNFDDFQKIVGTAQHADAVKADLKRALKKVNTALGNLQTALSEADAVLSDEYVSTPKERKPRQPRAPKLGDDGTPKKPGRPKKTA